MGSKRIGKTMSQTNKPPISAYHTTHVRLLIYVSDSYPLPHSLDGMNYSASRTSYFPKYI